MSHDPYLNPHRDPSDGVEHMWVTPPSAPCPDCPCCSKRLCELAQEKGSACHWLGGSGGGFDLSLCPCWHKPGRERDLAGRLQQLKSENPRLSYLEIRALELKRFSAEGGDV